MEGGGRGNSSLNTKQGDWQDNLSCKIIAQRLWNKLQYKKYRSRRLLVIS